MKLSDEQIRTIALSLKNDIISYINEHKLEYEEFLQQEKLNNLKEN